MTMNMSISQRNAQVLRYFQQYAPVGEWFTHDHKAACTALGLNRAQLSVVIGRLVVLGYLDRSARSAQRFNYRVDPLTLELEARPLKKAQPRKPKKPQLIRYAGWEQHAGDAW